jgi:hypothetical protein
MKTSGPAVVSGGYTWLGGNYPSLPGLIVSSNDLDPLSGLKLGVFGMGSPVHFIGNSVP